MSWDTIRTIIELLAVVVGGGWLIRLLTVKSHVKQEEAEANKSVEELKEKQIDNIKKIMDDLYQPMIEDLKKTVEGLKGDVSEVKTENEGLKKEIAELRDENSRLRRENEELRDAVREIRPDVVPSRRSINASNQARNDKGQFTKSEAE